jgi:hypothetical protein
MPTLPPDDLMWRRRADIWAEVGVKTIAGIEVEAGWQ